MLKPINYMIIIIILLVSTAVYAEIALNTNYKDKTEGVDDKVNIEKVTEPEDGTEGSDNDKEEETDKTLEKSDNNEEIDNENIINPVDKSLEMKEETDIFKEETEKAESNDEKAESNDEKAESDDEKEEFDYDSRLNDMTPAGLEKDNDDDLPKHEPPKRWKRIRSILGGELEDLLGEIVEVKQDDKAKEKDISYLWFSGKSLFSDMNFGIITAFTGLNIFQQAIFDKYEKDELSNVKQIIPTAYNTDYRKIQNGLDLDFIEMSLYSHFDDQAEAVIIAGVYDNRPIEVDEAYIKFYNILNSLSFKAGYFLLDFGKLNNKRRSELPQIDKPLALHTLFGEQGLKGPGISTSWFSKGDIFDYSKVVFQVISGQNKVAFSGEGTRRPISLLRFNTKIFFLNDKNLDLGTSYSMGYNDTIYKKFNAQFVIDGDINWPFKFGGKPVLLNLASEVFFSRREESNQTKKSMSLYSMFNVKYNKILLAGIRYDFVQEPKELNDKHWMISPVLTWVGSGPLKISVQYCHAEWFKQIIENSLILRFSWVMGTPYTIQN